MRKLTIEGILPEPGDEDEAEADDEAGDGEGVEEAVEVLHIGHNTPRQTFPDTGIQIRCS